jgi:hypothetical protein
MNNRTVQRIKELDTQIKAVNNYLKDGEHAAAGLTVSLGIGAESSRPIHLAFGLMGKTEAILETLLSSLAATREYYTRQAMAEQAELNELLKLEAPK